MKNLNLKKYFYLLLFIPILLSVKTIAADTLNLRDRLSTAEKGDYLVIARSKNNTLLHIYDKTGKMLTVEEITAPAQQIPKMPWQQWIMSGSPGSSSWVRYKLDLSTGRMEEMYSVKQNCWLDVAGDQLFSTLLNLSFTRVPAQCRKRIGTHRGSTNVDPRFFWHPSMIINGKSIPGVIFDAWRARWPKDGSELSDKEIEIYLPVEIEKYPAYFPYWLQISGTVSRVNIRVIDSGRF